MIQEEQLNIKLYEHDFDKSNNFAYMWKNIAYAFTFTKKLKKDVNKEKEYVININKNGYYREKYMFDTSDLVKTSTDSEEVITTQRNFHYGIINSMYAVQDTGKQPNRYFIGFVMDNNILGIIVYFDELGNSGITNVLYNTLYNYDFRNGFPNTYLYNQSLIFTQTHRDTRNLILGINLLDSNDKCLHSKYEYTKINSSIFNMYDRDNNFNIDNGRFIIVNDRDLNLTLIDMGSLKLEEKVEQETYFYVKVETNKKYKYLNINMYKLEKKEDLQEFISNFNKEPEVFGNLDYPELCIMCNKLTDMASIQYEYLGSYGAYMSLGLAYCDTCKVRFSKTDNKWICCKLKPNEESLYFCNNEVTTNNPCCKEHSTTMETKIYHSDKKSIKYPFKRTIQLTNK